jgi:hypothetical protein
MGAGARQADGGNRAAHAEQLDCDRPAKLFPT